MKKFFVKIFSIVALAILTAPPMLAERIAEKTGSRPNVERPVATAEITQQVPDSNLETRKAGKSFFDNYRENIDKMNSSIRVEKSNGGAPVHMTAPKANAVMKAEGNYPDIYASVVSSSPGVGTGLFSIPTTAESSGFVKKFSTQYAGNYGGALCDGIYYINCYYQLSIMKYYYVLGYQFETGELCYSYKASNFRNYFAPGGMALDPVTGKIFGIYYNASANGYDLASMDYPKEGSAAPEKSIVYSYGNTVDLTAFSIDKQGQFYAIKIDSSTGEGILVKIDRSTGSLTDVGPTGFFPVNNSSATIDTKTNRMFWSVSPSDKSGQLVEVNLQTGVGTLITQYDNKAWLDGMFVPVPDAEDGAPDVVTNVTVNFSEDSLHGTVTATAPTTCFDGTTLSGNVSMSVAANGQVVATNSNIAPGAQTVLNVTVPAAGTYTFQVYASNEVGDGPAYKVTDVWVGADTPEATTATATYANGNMQLSWLPVTEGINGGYLDLDNLTYMVKNSEGETIAQGLTQTSYTFELAEPESITTFYYTVYAVCNGLTSEGAVTNSIVLGAIVPPYLADFAKDGVDGWTIINANDDKRAWGIQRNGEMGIEYCNSPANPMDDWLITPPVKLESGMSYEVSFNVSCESNEYPEKIEVKWGTSPTVEGMTNVLLEPTEVTAELTRGGQVYTKLVVPEADGKYYIGFHAISDPDTYVLYIGDIQIAQGSSAEVPGMPTNLTLTPGQGGSLTCAVSFNAPDKTINGKTLTSLDKVELYRDETLINTYETPAPGAALTYDDVLEMGGEVTYTVVGYNNIGEGLKATASTLIGFDIPLAPAYCEVSRTDAEGEVLVTWAPVTQDVNGNTLGEDDVTYIVCYDYNDNWRVQAMDIKGTSYSWKAIKDGDQDFVQCMVYAQTTAGIGDGSPVSDMIPVGTPYAGLDETFANGYTHYIWGLQRVGTGGNFVLAEDDTFADVTSPTGDNGFFAISSQSVDSGGGLFSGLVSTNQIDNPALTFYTYNINNGKDPDINLLSVLVNDVNTDNGWVEVMAPVTVDELCSEIPNKWAKVTVPLTEYSNKTIQVMIRGVVEFYTYIMLDDIKVGSILNHDLGITSITAPSGVNCGEDYTIEVKVVNEGIESAASYSVELYENEKLAETQELRNLESGKITTVSFPRTMSPLATEPATYFAKVVYSLDENADNNQSLSVTVTPEQSVLPTATNLTAESSEDGVILTWEEPDLSKGMVITESFEDAESFSDKYGDWTFVDLDKGVVGGLSTGNLPGITPGVTTGSFWIWDSTDQTVAAVGDAVAHSGNKFLFTIYNDDDSQVDDWAISPLLKEGPQTISFYARSYSSAYPEKIEVLWTSEEEISKDNFDASKFEVIEGSVVNPVPNVWTLYQYDLPAEAKHFAIRSYAEGAFMLFVDDVTFIPANSTDNLEIEGYNVYRDGVKINATTVANSKYLDETAVDDEVYTYVVTVVYNEGESAASNEATIKFSNVQTINGTNVTVEVNDGNIIIRNAQDLNVSVASANGMMIYTGSGKDTTVVKVTTGVYVVKCGNEVFKVLVK